MKPIQGHIYEYYLYHTAYCQTYSASGCKHAKAICRDVYTSDWAVMLCLQQNVLEVQRPQTDVAVVRTSDTERLVHTHALQRQIYSRNIHTYILVVIMSKMTAVIVNMTG